MRFGPRSAESACSRNSPSFAVRGAPQREQTVSRSHRAFSRSERDGWIIRVPTTSLPATNAASATATAARPAARIASRRWKSSTTCLTRRASSPATPSPADQPASGATRACSPCPRASSPIFPLASRRCSTPAVSGKRIGAANLYLKNDAVCFPTLSFKDRVVAVALANAQKFGFDTVGCSSTGNLANSVAAQAARLGLKACILVPADLEPAKILNTLVYGARLIRIDGNYDHVNRLSHPDRRRVQLGPRQREPAPLLRRGIQDRRLRDRRAARLAPAGQRRRSHGRRLAHPQDPQGLQRTHRLGLVEEASRPCASSARRPRAARPSRVAVKNGWDHIEPQKPNTIARSLAIGNPADGPAAGKMIRDTRRLGGGRLGRRDRLRHSGARRDRRHLYRDRRRRHHRRHRAPLLPRPHLTGRDYRHVHHRQRPQDHRRARRPLRPPRRARRQARASPSSTPTCVGRRRPRRRTCQRNYDLCDWNRTRNRSTCPSKSSSHRVGPPHRRTEVV